MAERPRFDSACSSCDDTDQEQILATLRHGQAALWTLRLRLGATWLCLCFVCATVSFYWPSQADHTFLEQHRSVWVDFFSELLFDARLVFPALAPLGDDVIFMRCVLALEAGFFAFLRIHLLSGMCANGGAAWHSLSWSKKVDNVIWLSRGFVFITYSIWAMRRRTPRSLQRCLWFSLVVYAVPSAMQYVYSALIQDWSRIGRSLANIVVLCVVLKPQAMRSLQARLRCWVETRGATRAAAAIACLVGRTDAKEALDQAKRSFRSVDLSKLAFEDLATNASDPRLNALAEPTKLGRCDAFVSHSWHDDATAKWGALQEWRSDFRERHGREPRVWLDKLCIDQNNIEADLRCLPISLSGCRSLLVLCGPTYLSRLWCIIEIFTFIMMGGSAGDIEVALVQKEDTAAADEAAIVSAFEKFDAANCKCFDPADKDRILAIIETAFGTLGAFNVAVSTVLSQIQTENPVLSHISLAVERLKTEQHDKTPDLGICSSSESSSSCSTSDSEG